MPTERLTMRQIREILRQKWTLGRSHRVVASSLRIAVGTVSIVVGRSKHAGLTWEAVQALDDATLEARVYGPPVPAGVERPPVDPLWIHTELKKTGVTRELLYREYRDQHPTGYAYSKFCEVYAAWLDQQRPLMRQEHRAGEKLFVDYSGKRPEVADPLTGECVPVELFVAVLGASNFTYAEATATQRVGDWISSHVRALEFFGGVPGAIVPDQLKSGVTRPCRYEPMVQHSYEEFAQHYGTVVLPARPAHPRDKAKAEVGVQVVQRWVLARLRNLTFFSLAALNATIAELLKELNARPMRVYAASRRDLFDQLDRPALRPLPTERFTFAEWKKARVNIDYHVELEGHYYSVPYTLMQEEVDLRFSANTVEVYRNNQRVAVHARSHLRGRHSTTAEHMPKAHQRHADWSPSRLCHWASTIGPSTEALVTAILADRPHPEQSYRSCLGILRLGNRYGNARLEAACTRALRVGARTYRNLDSILKNGLDRVPPPAAEGNDDEPIVHPNLRGRDYYH